MTRDSSDDPRALPAAPALPADPAAVPPSAITPAPDPSRVRQLGDLPKDELDHLAEEFGIDPRLYESRHHLVAALHDRRQAIADMDRSAMLDVVKWGRRPVSFNATKEQLAQEIAKIRSMRFAGLSHAGLLVLARMRGVRVDPADPVPHIVKRLKKQEGLFSRINRKRRAVLGSIVSNLIGEEIDADYQFLPPPQGPSSPQQPHQPPPAGSRSASLRDEIEDEGLFGGIAGRIKRSADSYVNQKLDEIEARIDRKLDEIDRRLGEWRDKEVANRIRILKITLWASVLVAVFSLIYSYVKVYFVR